MQLPPTILSLNEKKRKKEKEDKKAAIKPKTEIPQNQPVEAVQGAEPISDAESEGSENDEEDPIVAEEASAEPEESPEVTKKVPKKAKGRGELRPPRTLETTLFDRLENMYGPGIKRMLNVQYRYVFTSSCSLI